MVHFATIASVIFALQSSYNSQLCTDLHTALQHDTLGRLLITSQQFADIARLTAMPYGKLIFDPFPTDPLDYASWFELQYLGATATVLKVKYSNEKTEQISFVSIYLMGWSAM